MIDRGFSVIRIREEPLPALPKFSKNDISVEKNPTLKDVVDAVLKKIEDVCNIKIDGLGEYLRLKNTVNKMAADEYIAQLLRDKEQTTLDVD